MRTRTLGDPGRGCKPSGLSLLEFTGWTVDEEQSGYFETHDPA